MPIGINGSGTITGVSVGGLPDGIVDTDMLAAKTATAPKLGNGSILQVICAQKTDSFSTSSASWNNVPSLQADITMTNASNKVLVQVNISALNGTTTGSGAGVQRNGTFIGLGTSYGNRQNISGAELYHDRNDVFRTSSFTILDTPGAGTHTYVVLVDPNGNTLYVNRSEGDGDTDSYSRGTSDITLMEVAA